MKIKLSKSQWEQIGKTAGLFPGKDNGTQCLLEHHLIDHAKESSPAMIAYKLVKPMVLREMFINDGSRGKKEITHYEAFLKVWGEVTKNKSKQFQDNIEWDLKSQVSDMLGHERDVQREYQPFAQERDRRGEHLRVKETHKGDGIKIQQLNKREKNMKIKLSKSQWETIGKTAGWIKTEAGKKPFDDEDADFRNEKAQKGKKDKMKDLRDKRKGKEKSKMNLEKDDD